MEGLYMQNNILKMKRRMIIVLIGTIVMGIILIPYLAAIFEQFSQGWIGSGSPAFPRRYKSVEFLCYSV